MKIVPTYILSWIGLIGILGAQTSNLLLSDELSLWTGFIVLAALTPIKGFICDQRYTFQWAGFLSLFFLIVGVSEFFIVAQTTSSSFIMLCSSVILYFGVVFHAKRLGYLASISKAQS